MPIVRQVKTVSDFLFDGEAYEQSYVADRLNKAEKSSTANAYLSKKKKRLPSKRLNKGVIMTGKPVDEENLRKRAGVSSYESNMICASLERLATKSDSEIERTCFNNGGPSFYLLKEEELKSLSDDNIKCKIGSDNYKKNYRTSYKKKR